MRHVVSLLSIVMVVASGCVAEVDPIGGAQAASTPTVHDCTVDGFGSMLTGEAFSGTAASIAGFDEAEWVHNGSSPSAIESDGPATDVTCRLNGGVVAEITGPATVDGASGYTYFVQAVDNRPPTAGSPIVLEATRPRHGHGSDGTVSFSDPTTVQVPAQVDVVDGDAGHGWVWLKLDQAICFYRGNGGGAYDLTRCVGRGGHGLEAGDTLDVTRARLHIAGCGGGHDALTVRADIGLPVAPSGVPDVYTILVGDGSGTVIYSFSANVEDGDIAIVLDP